MMSDLERHDWVKRCLHERKITFQMIANELSVSASHVTLVSQQRRQSHTISEAIAVKLGMELSEVWPNLSDKEAKMHDLEK